jgi:hypothetical protein
MKQTKAKPLPKLGNKADLAVRLLMDLTGDELVLMQDTELSLYLIPSVMTDDTTDHLKPGTIEYQLSDGLPNERTHSEDFTSLRAAIKRFRELAAAGGWTGPDSEDDDSDEDDE